MRWLFRSGSQPNDAPQIITLQDEQAAPATANVGPPVQFLDDGNLRVNVSNAAEARAALVALQRRQRELFGTATQGASSGVIAVGGTLVDGVTEGGRRVRDVGRNAVRRVRFRSQSSPGPAATSTSGVEIAADTIETLALLPQLTEGTIASVKLIGAAAQAIAEAVPDIDLSDFDFLEILDILDVLDL